MKQHHGSVILIGIILFFFSTASSSGEKITIVSTNYPPHIYKEGDEVKGLRVELLTKIIEQMGYRYHPKIEPWARAIDSVKNGDMDGICSIWHKPEREAFLQYPKYPLHFEVTAIYQPKGTKPILYRSIEDFKGLTIGTIIGFGYPKEFMESTLFTKEKVVSDEQNFSKLASGRVDAIISDSILGGYKIKQYRFTDKIYRNPNNFNKGIWGYLAFSKKNPKHQELAEKFDHSMKKLVSNGFYAHIYWKYLDRGPDKQPEIDVTQKHPSGQVHATQMKILTYEEPPITAYSQEPLVFSQIVRTPDQVIGAEILKRAYQKLGISIRIDILPGKRALAASSKGVIDGEVHRIYQIGEDYPTLIRVPTPINYIEPSVFSKNKKFMVTDCAALKDYKIARVRGIRHAELCTEGMKQVQVVSSSNELMLFLEAERADVGITAKINGLLQLKKLNIDSVFPLSPPLSRMLVYHYLHWKHNELVPKIDKVFKSMEESGELERI
ncbi:transporter substrate-binding domain-containing protein, partial [Desulfobacterales bacterium HSG17]|nr:transporter substrate-binding domain-containing protein [Desulfobacterales bacterium HSG17]